ncbi:ATP-dependent nuclease subunit B-like protein [Flexistipes sinusarabici DSM 4947]|uniref:ATP-dependent nuclease subunit B-like protein n=1 Tax=Flexistipes sinusarabici (strain ATCC 49648 / DSM 4947 / MAS 10) TaxID=717231 RepID=F8E936_FLESM|nr:PD-(D/E)XK nuclease family protein [Flexistipes sinusarabici]AEI15238.1 ATP-dependent nuclease subunit B-like protein [Flexistipes sinusarabici DSM 4947]
MKSVLKSLENICSKNITKRKILVMPSYTEGLSLLNALALNNVNIANIKVETPLSLAKDISKMSLYKSGKDFLDRSSARYVVLNLFNQLLTENKLKYFQQLSPSVGVISELENVLYELRITDYTHINFPVNSFIDPEKEHDIKTLLQKYENYLENNNRIDEPGLYKHSIQMLQKDSFHKDKLFLIPANLELPLLSKSFISMLTKNNHEIIKFAQLKSLNVPENYYSNNPYSDTIDNCFSWLYELNNSENLDKNPGFEIYRAYGESNEAKKVIRVLKRDAINLDDAVIYTTSSQLYNQILYDLSCTYNIPMTFEEGISVSNTSPGKLLLSVLEWISEKYSVPKFCTMSTGGFFKFSNNEISPLKISKILKESKIAWGKKRYKKILENELTNTTNDYKIEILNVVLSELNSIFDEIPDTENTSSISLSEFSKGLVNILNKHTRIRNETDASALTTLTENLSNLADYSTQEFQEKEIIKMLKKLVYGININASSAKPGHIHVTNFQNGIWHNRKHNFILGLDAEKFPGKGGESPFLLDMEKERIGKIQTSIQRKSRNIYKMTELLANTNGKIYAMFTNYDTEAARLQSPSSLLLQIYRLQEKLDKSTPDKEHIESYLPFKNSEKEILDETELWLHKAFYSGGIKNNEEIFPSVYPVFNKGLFALSERQSSINEYNGCELNISDEIVNKLLYEKTFSNSKLETMGSCPLRFFFQHILYLKPLEEYEYDPWRWLDPLERGTLLHRIFELFYKELINKKEMPELDKHMGLLENIAKTETEELKDLLQPPSETVYESEFNEILDSCRIFLQKESTKLSKEGHPLYLELYFGNYPESEGSSFPTAVFTLPSGRKIQLSGRIDRIDQLNNGSYKIIDYKTGSTRDYSSNEYFKKGKQLQHALYSLAFEKLMGNKYKISQSGYYFPTTKGEGSEYMYPPSDGKHKREEVLEIVDILLDNIENRFFPPVKYDNKNDSCRFCDYKEICDREKNDSLTKMLEYEENKYLQNYRRIESYE